jgi:Domain of unknown function (DUF4278)
MELVRSQTFLTKKLSLSPLKLLNFSVSTVILAKFIKGISTLLDYSGNRTMQLSYRGVSYEVNPSREPSIQGEVIGKYRGAVLRSHNDMTPPAPQAFVTLKYRGISYQSVVN